jgi:hypothetical protein
VISTFTAGVGDCQLTESAAGGPYTVTATYSGDSNWASAVTTTTNAASFADGGTITAQADQIEASTNGGTANTDSISTAEYGTDPVGNLTDGSNYFDVAASAGNTFASINLSDCDQITTTSTLAWWDPTLNAGAGGWAPVVGDPGPTYEASSPACLTAVLDGSSYPTISQLTGTVFASVPSIAFVSADATTATVGTPLDFTVATLGTPTPTLTESGTLPRGVNFVDNANGTATFSGTPVGNKTGGAYPLTLTASYGTDGTDGVLHKSFDLVVIANPVFTGPRSLTVFIGASFDQGLVANGFPAAVLTETGALPAGVSFASNENGTAKLYGTPLSGAAGTYKLTLTATNHIGSNVTESFTVMVPKLYVTTPTLPAATRGTHYRKKLTASGGVSPYTWKAVTKLPKGLSLSRTGTISGTPSKSLDAGTSSFTVKVTDASRHTHLVVTEPLTIVIS